MLAFALLLQIQATDSVYSSPALREFVARAAIENRAPPPRLTGYRAIAETELAFILRDSLGREDVGQIEQIAARAEWERNGRYELHVLGYRAQSLGAPYSALTFTRMYTTPVLYGNRLAIGMNDGLARTKADTTRRRKRLAEDSAAGREPFVAVHPLSASRDKYYRFTGGDTVAAIFAGGRSIKVVRVLVEPIKRPESNFIAFVGELNFDAEHFRLVRMRGRFDEVTSKKDPLFVRTTGAVAEAFIEFENVEIAGEYWLPATQRSEFVAQMGIMGSVRPIYRIVTRFRDYQLGLSDSVVTDDEPDSTRAQIPATRSKLTFASKDSVDGFGGWTENLGTTISSVAATDFQDLEPDVWRPTGLPSFSYWPNNTSDVARYNRVEGMFTGVSGTLRLRDVAPGVTVRGLVGFAWEEQTVRGALAVSRARNNWIVGARAERSLATTNDFLASYETGLSIGPLLWSIDDNDYVDRRVAALSATRIIKDVDRALLTAEIGVGADRLEIARLTSGVLSTGESFRPNRTSAPGHYSRTQLKLEFHPRVTGEGLSPGFGARVDYEVGTGELDWQRVDVRLAARRYWHGLIFASRVEGGAVFGSTLPPQVMYELGGSASLPSYEYKEFGGDRVVLGRGLMAYYFPFLRAPIRVRSLVLPGVSPGLGVGASGGWSDVTTPAAQAAMLALGGDGITPLSVPTGRVRATADIRLTILSGAMGVGVARAVDHPARWRPFFVWGAGF